tara:strand:+ start:1442 stop:1606 length:165 start_codon:yes stop_codon:yes gene_type:complete
MIQSFQLMKIKIILTPNYYNMMFEGDNSLDKYFTITLIALVILVIAINVIVYFY